MSAPKSLHLQLLDQARHLAIRERRKPTQASLRRAISAAYYALFHFLVSEATISFVGGSPGRARLRHALARAFQHRVMAEVSKKFCTGPTSLPAHLKSLLSPLPIPAQLQSVAQTFVDLQEERHQADYNLATQFIRADVLNSISLVELAFRNWSQVKNEEASRLYLLLLLAWPGMQKD